MNRPRRIATYDNPLIASQKKTEIAEQQMRSSTRLLVIGLAALPALVFGQTDPQRAILDETNTPALLLQPALPDDLDLRGIWPSPDGRMVAVAGEDSRIQL